MKALFTAINQGDLERIREIVERKPDVVNATAHATPKRDFMQSPLYVAVKNIRCDIVRYLVEHGADVNFRRPKEGDELEWTVLHQAMYTAVYRNIRRAGWSGRILEDGTKEYLIWGNKDRFDDTCANICCLLEAGADINAPDSRGWTPYATAVHFMVGNQVRCFFPECQTVSLEDAKPDIPWQEDVKKLLGILISYGADTSVPDFLFEWRNVGARYIQNMMASLAGMKTSR